MLSSQALDSFALTEGERQGISLEELYRRRAVYRPVGFEWGYRAIEATATG